MTRPLVKVCGLTDPEDARLAQELGADLVGCVRAADSPRHVPLARARGVLDAAPRCRRVLVMRGAALEDVLADADALAPDLVQLHATPAAVVDAAAAAGVPLLRVHAVARGAGVLPPLDPPPDARRPALLDVGRGGGGRPFDWTLLGPRAPAHVLVAGGITPANLPRLLAHRPWGLDVSSGVEARPGRKDPERLRALFARLEDAA